MYIVLDYAVAILLALPLIIVSVEHKTNNSHAVKIFHIVTFLNVMMLKFFLTMGDIFTMILFTQFLFVWPLCIAFHMAQGNSPHINQVLHLKKEVKRLGISVAVICCVIIGVSLPMISKDVKIVHEELFTALQDAPDPLRILMIEGIDSSSLVYLPEKSQKIASGEVRTIPSPWKTTVEVTGSTWREKLTYVRVNGQWKIEGNYESSYQTP